MKNKTMIVSTGSYVPEDVRPNDSFIQFSSNSIPLIEQKTGIKTRRFAASFQNTSDLAAEASRACLSNAKLDPENVEAIILSTSSPDRFQPHTASTVQALIGAKNAFAFDINAVCSGSIYALQLADSMIKSGFCNNALVVASELYSRFLNPKDFSTYPYFGDGAGALLIKRSDNHCSEIIHTILKTDGSGANIIQIPAGGTMIPYKDIKNQNDIYFKMKGKEVYQFATTRAVEVVQELIETTGASKDDIKFIVPHQANINIIRELSSRLGITYDRFFVNLDRYGNTASASVLIALDELVQTGRLKRRDFLVLVAFGGGLSWGATLVRY